jgi:hypothetical protein
LDQETLPEGSPAVRQLRLRAFQGTLAVETETGGSVIATFAVTNSREGTTPGRSTTLSCERPGREAHAIAWLRARRAETRRLEASYDNRRSAAAGALRGGSERNGDYRREDVLALGTLAMAAIQLCQRHSERRECGAEQSFIRCAENDWNGSTRAVGQLRRSDMKVPWRSSLLPGSDQTANLPPFHTFDCGPNGGPGAGRSS